MAAIKPFKKNDTVLSTLGNSLPPQIKYAGVNAEKRFIEFFTAQIRNKNTRLAYGRAVMDFFSWCEENGNIALVDIEPVHVAAWVEMKMQTHSNLTVKQYLSGLRHLFDWLVTGHIIYTNPAAAVRPPRYSSQKGKTPILVADEARALLSSIPTDTMSGLRDRALIGLMTYSFARISAALSMNVKDVFYKQHRMWLRLHEKGGKYHEMPCHHNLEIYLREYMDAAGLNEDKSGALFRSIDRKTKTMGTRRFDRSESRRMVKRRCRKAGILTDGICNHSFRGTGITAYLENPLSKLEHAQQMAGHADPKTTRMYDRRSDEVSLDEVERIGI